MSVISMDDVKNKHYPEFMLDIESVPPYPIKYYE